MKKMSTTSSAVVAFFLLLGVGVYARVPKGYKGRPFMDEHFTSGPQTIPGTIQCVLYDLGGEGVAYHDTDAYNRGSGGEQPQDCKPGTPEYVCYFRANEGVDISYTKVYDLDHPNLATIAKDQMYIGWTEEGEWVNYTVKVKKAGTYRINFMYANKANTLSFSLNNQAAAECKLPLDTGSMHNWNKAMCGEITFPKAGLQLLTLHYTKGNNLAYFELVPVNKK